MRSAQQQQGLFGRDGAAPPPPAPRPRLQLALRVPPLPTQPRRTPTMSEACTLACLAWSRRGPGTLVHSRRTLIGAWPPAPAREPSPFDAGARGVWVGVGRVGARVRVWRGLPPTHHTLPAEEPAATSRRAPMHVALQACGCDGRGVGGGREGQLGVAVAHRGAPPPPTRATTHANRGPPPPPPTWEVQHGSVAPPRRGGVGVGDAAAVAREVQRHLGCAVRRRAGRVAVAQRRASCRCCCRCCTLRAPTVCPALPLRACRPRKRSPRVQVCKRGGCDHLLPTARTHAMGNAGGVLGVPSCGRAGGWGMHSAWGGRSSIAAVPLHGVDVLAARVLSACFSPPPHTPELQPTPDSHGGQGVSGGGLPWRRRMRLASPGCLRAPGPPPRLPPPHAGTLTSSACRRWWRRPSTRRSRLAPMSPSPSWCAPARPAPPWDPPARVLARGG